MPRRWEEFQEYWDRRSAATRLEINQATLDIFSIRIPKPWFVVVPTAVWDQLFRPMVGAWRWIAAGLFDAAGAAEKAGMRWTPGDGVGSCGCSASWWSWRFVVVPDEIGCTRGRWPPTVAPTAACPTMRRLLRRPRS